MGEKKSWFRLDRRKFGKVIAGLGASATTLLGQEPQAPPPPSAQAPPAPQGPRRRPMVPDSPPFEAPLEFKRRDVAARAAPFPMTQVRLLAGACHDAQEWNRGYMSRLTADRLVYNFRANAGLPVGSATPFGGWERPDDGTRASELRGHFTGHFLSASALLYASTGDTQARAKGEEIVAELAKCQERLGGRYLSAFPSSFWDRLEKKERVWAPFYTIHKIMAGMLDMYQFAGNKQALAVLEGMAAWADDWTKSKTEQHMQEILENEFGGIGETLYHLAALTNNDHWARVGDRFQKKAFLNPLALGRDELRGLHVNTHIPQAIAAARRYELSGDYRFRTATEFFFHQVTTARSYVTGGTSNGELWLAPPHRLAAELPLSVSTAECCCAYNMMKLARMLYSWRPDSRMFDYYEKLVLNHRLGTIRPHNGYTQYYLSLTPGAWKTFNTEDQSFWCCTGTGVEEYAKLNDSIYWRDGEGLLVNLFIPSELDWAEKGFKLRQETRYPDSASVTLIVTSARQEALSVRLRIPGWLDSPPTVKLNGKPVNATAAPGSYLALRRTWKKGDVIQAEFPMRLRIEAMPDDPSLQAILYGPLVLAGDLGDEGLTPKHIIGPNRPRLAPRPGQAGPPSPPPDTPPPVPEIEIPTFHASASGPDTWIKPGDQPMTFRTVGQKKDVTLVPLNRLFDRRYSVYWQVTS